MHIITLIENSPHPANPVLKAEHGLSFYIEHEGHVLMSDLGATNDFAKNAALLGVDLEIVEAVTISHHHYDHGGGMARFFAGNDHAKVYLRRAETEDYIVPQGDKTARYIGLDTGVLAVNVDRIEYLDADNEILPGVHVLTNIPAIHPKATGDQRLKMVRDGQTQRDTFEHEIVTVLEGKDGLIVLTGCAHNGVLNMVVAVREAFPGKPILAIIGGFHLIHEDPVDVRRIGETLAGMEIPAIYTGHCTGEASTAVLEDVLGEKLHRLYTGLVIML